jgi:AbrB family looped-hinge helix DNA binding protein
MLYFIQKGGNMTTTIVTVKGQIVIPSKIRRHLQIKKGTKLSIEERDGELVLKPLSPQYFDRIAGILNTKGKLTKTLLAERIKEREREDRK